MTKLFKTIPTAAFVLGLIYSPAVLSAQASTQTLSPPVTAKQSLDGKRKDDKHSGEKDEKQAFSTDIHGGILTVDGMVGKAQMSYTVHQDYLYFTIPGVGTAIVSQAKFLNALPQKDAFHGKSLTIQASGHTVELTSDNPLVNPKVTEAWVAIDPLYGANRRFPEMGFGDTIQRPYVWPGAKVEKVTVSNAGVKPPQLPVALRPKPEVASSYSVTVPAAASKSKPAKP